MTDERKIALKKAVNRGGLIGIAVSVLAYILTGGDAGSAGQVVTISSGLAAAVLLMIREVILK